MAGLSGRKIGHRHHLHHHTSPAGEMLNALSLAIVRIVLLKSKPSFLPLSKDVVDQVLAQLGIHFTCLFLVGPSGGCDILAFG